MPLPRIMSWPKPSNLGLIASKHALKPTHITHTHTHTLKHNMQKIVILKYLMKMMTNNNWFHFNLHYFDNAKYLTN